MSYDLSQPADSLFKLSSEERHVETLIVGSGYGAAMSAFRLSDHLTPAEAAQIWVIERGREYLLGEFPKNVGDMPGYLGISNDDEYFGRRNALFDLKIGTGVSALVGSGLGGTSLINGGVAIDPPDEAFDSWPESKTGDWRCLLDENADLVKKILGVTKPNGEINKHPDPGSIAKFRALQKLASALGTNEPEAVPLAINFDDLTKNAIGQQQNKCINCGNCVTGCNIGAKNTLAMNVWPLVAQRGVKLFTGGKIIELIELSKEKDEYQWRVEVESVNDDVRSKVSVFAKKVILAAGTFGSTEILLRSNIKTSNKLGEYFSVNGDLMGFGYQANDKTDGFASTPSVYDDLRPQTTGPLTMSELRVELPGDVTNGTVSFQDASIPYPMRRVLAETMSIGYLARLFGDNAKPEKPSIDPHVIDDKVFMNSMAFTVMGREKGYGSIRLNESHDQNLAAGSEKQVIEPYWDIDNDKPTIAYVEAVEDRFRAVEKNKGFDGGLYISSPPWRTLPKELTENMDGMGRIKPRLLTTHPLGGCRMANSSEEGVVNAQGQVFTGMNKSETYDGLYVIDGSIIPGPIGVNPLMTISLLAYHLANEIKESAPTDTKLWQVSKPYGVGCGSFQINPADEHISSYLRERFFLDDECHPVVKELRKELGLTDSERLVLDVQSEFAAFNQWLEEPGQALPAKFQFKISRSTGDTVPNSGLVNWRGEIDGWVTLGGVDKPSGRWNKFVRGARAILKYIKFRGAGARQTLLTKSEGSLVKLLIEAVKALVTTIKQAGVVSRYRFMRYEFNGEGIHLIGQKMLAYKIGEFDPLKSLRKMPFTLDGTIPKTKTAPVMRVDMIRFMNDLAPFVATKSPNTPTLVVSGVATMLLFLRTIIQTHFWSFGAPPYQGSFDPKTKANKPRIESPPQTISYVANKKRFAASLQAIEYRRAGSEKIEMRLLRYTPEHIDKPQPLLMIHGLAHGTRVFWTDTVNENMAQDMLSRGHEIWMLDHRLSINLHMKPERLSVDDIATLDIPWAVRKVCELTEQSSINVFAHCIGAGAFQMALLNGCLNNESGTSLIKALVIHAVPPWLVPSEDNRWRANAISLFRPRWNDETYDPIPHDDPTVMEMIGDRFAFSFGWEDEEMRLHSQHEGEDDQLSRTICDRMTLFYGDEWIHKNLDPRTHKHLNTLVGPASIEVLKQAFFCVVKGRLTNRQGENAYISDCQIADNWQCPTLFLHGSLNKVFNVESSKISHKNLQDSLRRSHLSDGDIHLYITPGYGHMDMLFGKDAHGDVFPVIDHFLVNQNLSIDIQNESENRDSTIDNFPALVPVTGPIISNPRLDAGRKLLDSWVEVSTYGEQSPGVVYWTKKKGGPRTTINPSAPVRVSRAYAMEVRIDELNLSLATADVEISLQYPNAVASVGHEKLNWKNLPWYQYAYSNVSTNEIDFLIGSCLYPGSPAEVELSDKVFCAMRPFVQGTNGRGAVHLLLVGDQIYADATADIFDPVMPVERFQERYQRAFGGAGRDKGQNAHWVMQNIPTYFAIDDHEIDDNWPQSINEPLLVRYPGDTNDFNAARKTAWNFLIHQSETENKLWYSFDSGQFSYFVFDTRTQRKSKPRDPLCKDSLLCETQRTEFTDWLDDHQRAAMPLTLVMGSPLGPFSQALIDFPELSLHEDTLIGFPGFVVWLTQELANRGIREIILISGDNHQSSLSKYKITLDSGACQSVTVHQVIASGLYAPLPFVNRNWDSYCANFSYHGYGLAIDGEQHLLSNTSGHFVKAHISLSGSYSTLTVKAVDSNGEVSPSLAVKIN